MVSLSMICNNVCTILDLTVIDNEIDPIVEHRASLKAFNYNEGVHICEKKIFKFL